MSMFKRKKETPGFARDEAVIRDWANATATTVVVANHLGLSVGGFSGPISKQSEHIGEGVVIAVAGKENLSPERTAIFGMARVLGGAIYGAPSGLVRWSTDDGYGLAADAMLYLAATSGDDYSTVVHRVASTTRKIIADHAEAIGNLAEDIVSAEFDAEVGRIVFTEDRVRKALSEM